MIIHNYGNNETNQYLLFGHFRHTIVICASEKKIRQRWWAFPFLRFSRYMFVVGYRRGNVRHIFKGKDVKDLLKWNPYILPQCRKPLQLTPRIHPRRAKASSTPQRKPEKSRYWKLCSGCNIIRLTLWRRNFLLNFGTLCI